MREQKVTVTLPTVEIRVNGKVVLKTDEEVTKKVNGIRELRTIARRTLDKIDPNKIGSILAKSLEGAHVDVILENGTSITSNLIKGSIWSWSLSITDDDISTSDPRRTPKSIGYGSYLHSALWRKHREASYRLTEGTNRSLEQFNLTANGVITELGLFVLEELEKEDPSIERKRVMMFTGVLLSPNSKEGPAWNFAKEHNFIEYVPERQKERKYWYVNDFGSSWQKRDQWYPTEKGKDWLEQNALRILNHAECAEKRRIDIIPFSPLAYMAEFLTHKEGSVRKAAIERIKAVRREKGEPEDNLVLSQDELTKPEFEEEDVDEEDE